MQDTAILVLSGTGAVIVGGLLLYILKKIKSKLRLNILRSGGKFEED